MILISSRPKSENCAESSFDKVLIAVKNLTLVVGLFASRIEKCTCFQYLTSHESHLSLKVALLNLELYS